MLNPCLTASDKKGSFGFPFFYAHGRAYATGRGMSKDIDAQAVAKQLLSEISNDIALCTPVYLDGISSEEQAETMDNAPLVFLWNEDRDSGGFHLSVNSNIVENLLAEKISREHEQFELIREGAMKAIAQTAQASVVSVCEKLGAYPSQVFGKDKH